MDIIEKIELEKSNQSKIRTKISDFIISDPILCSFYSLKELSAALNVSEATILSYCKSLGIDKFVELKKQLQQYIMKNYSSKERFSFISKRNNTSDELYSRIIQEEKIAFNSTVNTNSLLDIEEFVKYIKQGEKIFIISHDFTDIAGRYLHKRISSFNSDVIIVNPFDIQDINKHLNDDCDKSKVVIAITIFPYGPTTLAFSDLAKKKDIPIISITDSKDSPICELSDSTLFCKSSIMGVTNTLVTLLLLIDIIAITLNNNSNDTYSEIKLKNYISTHSEEYTKLIVKYSDKSHDK
ncbi:MAG: MurR/RpiR family transcriptional regulator [Sphaerochaeta sp.]